MSADVVGYSRLMGVDESATLAALKAHRRELIDPKIAEYEGRIVKTTGDGLLLEFPSVVDAVRCAVDVQRGMAERNAGVANDKRLDFRIGINVGDIIIDGDDIYGNGVNVASRLEGLADPGGICASQVVRDQVLDKLNFSFESLGPQRVKNIARPIEVYRIDLGGDSVMPRSGAVGRLARLAPRAREWRWVAGGVLVMSLAGIVVWLVPPLPGTPTTSDAPPASVALLPFAVSEANVSEKDYADTLHHDLATALAADLVLKTVRVDAPPASDNRRELGRRFNVRYLVEGDVRRDRDSRLVNVRLIDAASGAQLWGRRYDFLDAATALDSLIQRRKLGSHVISSVWDAETQRIAPLPLDKLTAIELVIRGANAWGTPPTLATVKTARDLYDAALRLDPNLVVALVARADIVDAENDIDPKPDRDRIVRDAEVFSGRAVQLAPNYADAWRSRSQAMAIGGRMSAAIEAIDWALKLAPDRPYFLEIKALWMTYVGKPAESLVLVDEAMALQPEYVGFAMFVACQAHLFLGQVDEAIAKCEKSSPSEPNPTVQLLLAAAYAHRGDAAKAADAKARVQQSMPGYTIAQLRAKRYSDDPAYLKLAEAHWYSGLRKAGFPER